MAVAFRDAASVGSSAAVATQAVTIPSTTQVGDLIILLSCQRVTSATWTTPTGFAVTVGPQSQTNNTSIAYHKVAVTGDAGASVTLDPSGSAAMCSAAIVFSGVDTTTPIDVVASANDS